MDNNLRLRLMELLKSSSGQKAKDELRQMDMAEIEKRLMSVDKAKVIQKLESMNLSPLANKLKNMTDAEIIAVLRSNPSFLNLIEKL